MYVIFLQPPSEKQRQFLYLCLPSLLAPSQTYGVNLTYVFHKYLSAKGQSVGTEMKG